MAALEELIERTTWLHDEVDNLQHTIQLLQAELHASKEGLASKLMELRQSEQDLARHTLPGDLDKTLSIPFFEEGRERRSSARRRGNPVAVDIANPQECSTFHGWVVDRSPEGICMVSDNPASMDTLLKVRPSDHQSGRIWFEVEVRNCRRERAIWILNCRFTRLLSWNDLRLFQ